MIQEKGFQPLPQRTFRRPFHEAMVEHHACTDISALQRDEPCPPSTTYEMIGRSGSDSVTRHRPFRKLTRQFQSIPILDPAPSGPDRRGGMGGVAAEPAVLARE